MRRHAIPRALPIAAGAALVVVAIAQPIRVVAAQAARTGTVTGTARDSIARAPFVGALVQLAADGGPASGPTGLTRAVRTDSLGRFRIDSVPPGTYAVGFQHPRLDSLGVQAAVVTVRVTAGRTVRAELGSPSLALLHATYCGGARRGGTLVLGSVRRARDQMPLVGALVTGEWIEFVMRSGALDRRQPLAETRTTADGAFVLCDLPSEGSIFLRAAGEADSTDRIEIVADGSGVALRDLYLGPMRSIAAADNAVAGDSGATRSPARRTGDGTVRGRVSGVDRAQPVPNALVRIIDGPQVRADARGEFVLTGVPEGTRVLEVRAIGHYPAQVPVDVVAGSEPVRVGLWTFQAVLDTVTVRGASGDRSGGGFARRQRTYGAGSFLDSASVRNRGGRWTSDVFRSMNGIRVEGSALDREIVIRGAFDWCKPSFYIDGLYMATPQVEEIDAMVDRDRIMGIEVYPGGTVPAEFARAMDGCGAIVIWTRPASAPPRRARRPTGGGRPGA